MMLEARRRSFLTLICGTAALAAAPAAASRPCSGHEAFDALLEALADAWNDNDARRAANLFTEDAVYSEPPAKQLYQGREALFAFFGGPSGRSEAMRMTWRHKAFNPSTGVGAGEFTFAWPGGQVHGMVSIRLRDGLIANWREYFYPSEFEWEAFTRANRF